MSKTTNLNRRTMLSLIGGALTTGPTAAIAAIAPNHELKELLTRYRTVDAAFTAACIAEDEASDAAGPKPIVRVLGGTNPAFTMNMPDRVITIDASDSYYVDAEGIDRDCNIGVRKATSDAEREAVEARRAKLHAELQRQIDAVKVPPDVHVAAYEAAHEAWREVRNAILDFVPTNAAKAVELIDHIAARGEGEFCSDESELHDVLCNVAAGLRGAA